MIDRYTKAVLTLIAVGLLLNVFKDDIRPAMAQQQQCGSSQLPCFISFGDRTVSVRITDKVNVFETKTP
ncbi:hypothetical protein [Rhizobium redzepovicii]|uniref:hypothetical protein n=1 Tax=Rhizobium redzepovicii TaxID=2867518 RepID=UPI002871DCDD|nr:hypothetical protein [Rhizobium redzepovicii]MDR9782289.1 hypothetical protein [Rhizobium redzepovicii]